MAVNCHFLWRAEQESSCVRNLLVFWLFLAFHSCRRIKQKCLYHSGFSLRCHPRLHAFYRLCVSLNTLKSSRRSGSPRSQSLPVRLLLLCPRSNWRESHATREQRWRSWLPLKHHQDSERAGETSCRPSSENPILNKWGEVAPSKPEVILTGFNRLMSAAADEIRCWRAEVSHRLPTCRSGVHLDADVWHQRCKFNRAGTTPEHTRCQQTHEMEWTSSHWRI